jgi:hypothetical protein
MKEVPRAKRFTVARYYLPGHTYSDIEATKRYPVSSTVV